MTASEGSDFQAQKHGSIRGAENLSQPLRAPVTPTGVRCILFGAMAIVFAFATTHHRCPGRGAVWLARLHGVQKVAGSSPVAPSILESSTSIGHENARQLFRRGLVHERAALGCGAR